VGRGGAGVDGERPVGLGDRQVREDRKRVGEGSGVVAGGGGDPGGRGDRRRVHERARRRGLHGGVHGVGGGATGEQGHGGGDGPGAGGGARAGGGGRAGPGDRGVLGAPRDGVRGAHVVGVAAVRHADRVGRGGAGVDGERPVGLGDRQVR